MLLAHPAALDPEAQGALRWLTAEFRPELKRLGTRESVIEAIIGLAPTATPFADMPRTHWAYEAVESLRRKRILRRYPNGRFHTP